MLIEYTLSNIIKSERLPKFKTTTRYIDTGINFFTTEYFHRHRLHPKWSNWNLVKFKHIRKQKSFMNISYLERLYLPQKLSQISNFKSSNKNDKQISLSLFTLFKKSRIRKEI
jgi:hypothetical protein